MSKTRLNETHRSILYDFADKAVVCKVEQKARDRAYAKAAKLVSEAVQKQFPPADMEVLTKYKVSYADKCIRGGAPDGRFIGFTFDADDPLIPTVPSHSCATRSIAWAQVTATAIEAFAKSADDLESARRKKLSAYRTLISTARTFEEVVEIWPAANALRDRICRPSTALVALSEEVAEFIRHDNATAIFDEAA